MHNATPAWIPITGALTPSTKPSLVYKILYLSIIPQKLFQAYPPKESLNFVQIDPNKLRPRHLPSKLHSSLVLTGIPRCMKMTAKSSQNANYSL